MSNVLLIGTPFGLNDRAAVTRSLSKSGVHEVVYVPVDEAKFDEVSGPFVMRLAEATAETCMEIWKQLVVALVGKDVEVNVVLLDNHKWYDLCDTHPGFEQALYHLIDEGLDAFTVHFGNIERI